MNFAETLLFYLTIGVGVAAARWLGERSETASRRLLAAPGVVLFWPLFVPLLLAPDRATVDAATLDAAPNDELSRAIEQVDAELNAALADFDVGPESILKQTPGRLRDLRVALAAQAERIRRMEALLARDRAALPTADAPVNERDHKSRLSRQENMDRLAGLARRTRADLLATLAWIRELVSMIHLAKFTGQPAARAEELVAQIAAAVESIASTTISESA